MRALALGWLAGTAWLQLQPALPSATAAAIALASGLLLCCFITAPFSSIALIAESRRAWLLPLLLLLAGLIAGGGAAALRAQWRMADTLRPALEGRDIVVTGIVASLPDDVGRGQRFHFQAEHALDGYHPVRLPSMLALGWYDGDDRQAVTRQAVRPGERWRWTVRLKQPHGFANPYGFDEEAWLLSEGVRATGYVRPAGAERLDSFVFSFRDAVGRTRLWLRDRLLAALPSAPHAGVMVALVIGDQRGITQRDRDLFNQTGIGHLVSISGLHITMIAALAGAALQWLWRRGAWRAVPLPLRLPARKAGALAGLAAASVYVALAGFGVPALRTLLMVAVVTWAQLQARLLPVSRVLAGALLVVLVIDPWAVLWPGFWLSFGAIACILYASAGRAGERNGSAGTGMTVAASVQEGEKASEKACPAAAGVPCVTRWHRWRQALVAAAHTQWAVTAGLVPLTIGLFGQLSLVGPLANAIAIPLVSFVVTPLALLGVLLPPPFCRWLLWSAHQVFDALVRLLQMMVAAFSHLADAGWRLPQPDALTLALALAGTVWLLAPRGWPWRWAGVLCWMPMLGAQPSAPVSGFWLTALDIGQGNAVLIETAHHRLLYDTGPGWPSGSDAGERVVLPYLRARGITRLDGLMVSHADLDHAGGAASVLAALPVGWFSTSLLPSHPLVSAQARHVACVAGQHWQWDGVRFEVLHPLARDADEKKTNARSCTLRISYAGQSALLAGDIERAQEAALLAREGRHLQADVLLAPHHGSGTSSTPAFLDAVAPGLALFQVGYRNRYRHPKAEVVQRYRDRGIEVQRSDQAGAVRVEFSAPDKSAAPRAIPSHHVAHAYRCEQRRYWRPATCAAD